MTTAVTACTAFAGTVLLIHAVTAVLLLGVSLARR